MANPKRPGSTHKGGRPALSDGETVAIMFYVPVAERDRLTEIAGKRGESLSQYVRDTMSRM